MYDMLEARKRWRGIDMNDEAFCSKLDTKMIETAPPGLQKLALIM